MPRSRPNPRIDVCNVTSTLNPSSQQQENVEIFKKGRFQYFAPSHNSAVAIGSTLQNANPICNPAHSNSETHILDASTVVYSRGETGERLGVLMAVADGCNKVSDVHRNSSTGLVAKATCDHITSEAKHDDNADQLLNKAINAGQKSLEAQRNPDYKSSSTLNTAAINSNEGSFVKIGDGLLIVIDGTSRQVKEVINPARVLNATGKYVSATVQEKHQMKYPHLYLEKKNCDLHAGDIVILASRGLAEILPSIKTKVIKYTLNHPNPEKVNYIEYKIQLDKLNNILLTVFQKVGEKYNNSQVPAFAIANEFVNMAIELSFEQKQNKIAFAKSTETLIRQFKTDVIDKQNNEYQHAIKSIRAELAANITVEKLQELRRMNEAVRQRFLVLSDDNLRVNNDISGSRKTNVERVLGGDVNAALTSSLSKLTSYTKNHPEEMQALIVSFLKWNSIFLPGLNILIGILESPEYEFTIRDAIKSFIGKLKPINNNDLNQCISVITQNQNNFSANLTRWINQEPGFTTLEDAIDNFYSEEFKKNLSTQNNMLTEDFNSNDLLIYISYIEKEFAEKFQQIPVPTEKTVKDFKQWILDTRGPDDEYLRQLNEHLITMNINEAEPYHFLQNNLDINKMHFGDDTTIAVAYVPNKQLELVRAMIEFPDNRNQLLLELNKMNPTNESLELIYNALRSEQHVTPVEQTNTVYPQQTIGQRAEHLSHNIEHSYNEDELLDVEVFLLPKVKLFDRISQLIRQEVGETKETAQEKLKLLIEYEGLNVLEMCCLYNEIPAAQFDILNQHRRAGVDNFFGINITRTWSQTLKEIRDKALAKLRIEIDELLTAGRLDRALAILNKTLEAPLFNTHRNNFKITGAYGETAAITEIRKLIENVIAEKSIKMPSPVSRAIAL